MVANIYKKKIIFFFVTSGHHITIKIFIWFRYVFLGNTDSNANVSQYLFELQAGRQADLLCLFSSIIVTNEFVKVINDSEMRQSIASTLVFILFCKQHLHFRHLQRGEGGRGQCLTDTLRKVLWAAKRILNYLFFL